MPIELTDSLIDLSPLGPDATEAELRERVNSILVLARPLRQISGINGVKVHMSDANIIVETDPDGADDSGGATDNTSGSVYTPDTTADTTPGPVDHGDFGESFEPGDPSTPGAAVVYETRIRSGTATLVGFSEYTSASTPPKKYLVQTLAGQWRTCNWTVPASITCSGTQDDKDREVYAGAYTYDAATGTPTNAQTKAYGRNISTDAACDDNITLGAPTTQTEPFAPSFLGPTVSLNTTATVKTWTYSGACYDSGGFGRKPEGTITATLSTEDTDANAVTRLLATSPAWSGWTSAGAFPTATADYDSRTSGFTFDYQEKQLKATYTGMPAGWTFTVRVLIVKVDQTTSAVTNVETLVFTPTADGSGNASITADVVPAEQGYTWRVQTVGHYH